MNLRADRSLDITMFEIQISLKLVFAIFAKQIFVGVGNLLLLVHAFYNSQQLTRRLR
jgi:hypothetical protein